MTIYRKYQVMVQLPASIFYTPTSSTDLEVMEARVTWSLISGKEKDHKPKSRFGNVRP